MTASDEVNMREKRCTRCGRTKPREAFNKGSGSKGLQSWCRECARAYRKAPEVDRVAVVEVIGAQVRAQYKAAQDQAQDQAAGSIEDTAMQTVTADTPLLTAPQLVLLDATPGPQEPGYPEGMAMEVSDTLDEFMAYSETPSAFVHPLFTVVSLPADDGPVFYLLTPDQSGPRVIVPADLIEWAVRQVVGSARGDIVGRMYY